MIATASTSQRDELHGELLATVSLLGLGLFHRRRLGQLVNAELLGRSTP